ncbi:class I/II aminotransferase (macronuclear) [Tetrahymena thermophila SB210]|uniref:Class I/II aminotransferase n=1 Tax=Tetrahymena thermophila (strain SB210) TaxID=312017 RepID=I7LXC9_TETTS|nr:class I/II aminotransferase [Tetrahymena thermophila SB210]EAS04389.1 class I/II aminotransferase [Tetrahymena thermophila SB210]|eukprot:XP_001024634.1 class I/II aminotransferase [Tetrahymena thermophila SB210]
MMQRQLASKLVRFFNSAASSANTGAQYRSDMNNQGKQRTEAPKFITEEDINKRVINAEYAVRGTVPTRAGKIKQLLKEGSHNYPFNQLTECNIGNPQIFGQKPITFNRQVLSTILNPELVNSEVYSKDVRARAKYYLERMGSTTIGAYSDSAGHIFIRESIAKYIAKRDNHLIPPDVNDIILTDGASQGVQICLNVLISDSRDGIMIPIPQYPLYSASCTLVGASEVHYFLDEQKGWSCSVEELKKQHRDAKMHGINPKILVVINPGNPTGQVLSYDTIKQMIEFAYDHKMVIFADEVYQDNIYTPNKEFVSFKKVRSELPYPYNNIELFSFHSTSKGLLGECGLRGGYFEMCNIDSRVKEEIIKLRSMFLCSNTVGQCTTELMCNPPTLQNASAETVEQYNNERNALLESLKRRAQIVTESLNKMTNITCQEVEGAMYAFPSIKFGKKALAEAAKKKMEPDLFYCLNVLENTGIVLVPGSGFRQEENTYHFRITTLILGEDRLRESMEALKNYNEKFHKEYC